MPSLGADMDAGTVLEWHVRVGDAVRRGDAVALVQTDKADIDIEVFEDGIVEAIVVPAGTKVAVGTPLAHIGSAKPAAPAAPAATVPPPAPQPVVEVARPPTSTIDSPLVRHAIERAGLAPFMLRGTGIGGRVTRDDVERAAARAGTSSARPRVTPRARRLARQAGVDLVALGAAHAVVTGAHVIAAAGAPSAASAQVTPPPDPMRAAIARLMSRAWKEIPHYYLQRRIDVSGALAWMEAQNASRPVEARLIAPALMARAVALAAVEAPAVNGWWRDDRFVAAEGVQLAIATALRSGGLIAPVIADADTKPLDAVMAEMRDLVTRARANKLRGSEVTGASLTITSLGDAGADVVYGIIHPPQVAIIGIGAVREAPWAEHGTLSARRVVQVTVAGDHRASDGRDGAAFLAALERLLKEPEHL